MTSPREGTASLIAAVLEPMAVRLEFLGEVTPTQSGRELLRTRACLARDNMFFQLLMDPHVLGCVLQY